MRAAAADDDSFDHGATGVARSAGTAEDLDEHLLLALLPGAVYVVLETRAAISDTAFEDGADGGMEPLRRYGADLSGGRGRCDTSLMEGFVRVNVADAGDAALVE